MRLGRLQLECGDCYYVGEILPGVKCFKHGTSTDQLMRDRAVLRATQYLSICHPGNHDHGDEDRS